MRPYRSRRGSGTGYALTLGGGRDHVGPSKADDRPELGRRRRVPGGDPAGFQGGGRSAAAGNQPGSVGLDLASSWRAGGDARTGTTAASSHACPRRDVCPLHDTDHTSTFADAWLPSWQSYMKDALSSWRRWGHTTSRSGLLDAACRSDKADQEEPSYTMAPDPPSHLTNVLLDGILSADLQLHSPVYGRLAVQVIKSLMTLRRHAQVCLPGRDRIDHCAAFQVVTSHST